MSQRGKEGKSSEEPQDIDQVWEWEREARYQEELRRRSEDDDLGETGDYGTFAPERRGNRGRRLSLGELFK